MHFIFGIKDCWGDIQLNEAIYEAIKKNFDEEEKRLKSNNGTDRMAAPDFNIIPNYKWPSGPILYTTFLVQDNERLDLVLEAIQELESKTCLKFQHVEDANVPHIEFLEFDKPLVCADSPLGMQPTKNPIRLERKCKDRWVYVHEILHTLGFAHTQERPDVDQYIEFDMDNVIESMKPFFKPWAYAMTSQGPYDYGSIMQYSRYAFAIDKSKPTMTPKVDPEVNGPLMGRLKGLSDEDVRLLNKIYCEDPDPDKNANCIDRTVDCAYWAKIGKCDTDQFMKDNCKFSCNLCS